MVHVKGDKPGDQHLHRLRHGVPEEAAPEQRGPVQGRGQEDRKKNPVFVLLQELGFFRGFSIYLGWARILDPKWGK